MFSKRLRYSILIVVLLLLTGVSTQAKTLIPQIMLLLLSENRIEQNSKNITYDEVQLDLVILE